MSEEVSDSITKNWGWAPKELPPVGIKDPQREPSVHVRQTRSSGLWEPAPRQMAQKTHNFAQWVKSSSSLDHPWQIRLKSSGSLMQFKVNGDSDVYDGINFDRKTVTGLDTWTTARIGFVYLEGSVDASLNVTTITMKMLADLPERVTTAAEKQTKFVYVLGYLWSETQTVSDGRGGSRSVTKWYVRQEAFRHVTLLIVQVEGVICKVPFGI